MRTAAIQAHKLRRVPAPARDVALIALVMIATLAVELLLVERKYAIWGGGFGVSQALNGPLSVLIFALVVTACHAFAMTLIFLAMRWVHRRLGAPPALFRINFMLLVPAAAFGLLALKYEVLSYFSDAISFQLIRNLGGGSLFDALLFVLSEGALAAVGVIGGLAVYAVLLRWWMKRSGASRIGAEGEALKIRARWLIASGAALAAAIAGANMRPDVRSALGRFNAYRLITTVLSEASDFDRDGYSLFSDQIDRWPFDATRYPYALDIPNDGIDQDGLGGDFRIDARAARIEAKNGAATPVLPARRKNLVIVVLESTRYDALGRMVAGRAVTPNLNALAASGSSFPAAFSHVGFTTASLKSLFSGQLEPQAGGPSLFRDLKANGYRIGVFSGQPESFGDISEVVGMKQTADIFRDGETLKDQRAFSFAAKGSLLVDGKVLLKEFDRNFGQSKDWSRPVFLYFNLQSAHFPYSHPGMERILPGKPIPRDEISEANRGWTEDTYWNAVAQADSQIGALIARLKRLGVWDDTLLVVTADHGESLFDDGFLGHGHMLNLQQTHIPLIVNIPRVASAAPIGLYDYRPMILRLLGARGIPQRDPVKRPLLEYIGTLDSPTQVGMVEPGPRWTIFTPADRSLRFSDVPGTYAYDDIGAQPALKARADRLVAAWEGERWLAALRRPT
jgi:hypothetical protein